MAPAERLPAGGRVDRDRRCTFTFDGRAFVGLAGDTLASALLANGIRAVGRSFKLHRPRGVFAAGVEEPGALVTLRSGARSEPNLQATMVELHDGLEAHSQNCWPSRRLDLLAINGLVSRWMPAGFYYKTFMGPTRGAWMLYEPAIRRAAGLGQATRLPDPDRYEHVHAHCDVLVVGGGASGISAALAAGRAGARVVLLEQHAGPGGRLLAEPAGGPADAWLQARIAELDALDNVTVLTRTTAFGLYDGDVVGAVERAWDHVEAPPADQPRQRAWTLEPSRIVFATGATEQPLLFGDNDRPGVMLASAARLYVNHYAVLPGRDVLLATESDAALETALDLRRAGARVAVVDRRPHAGPGVAEALADAGGEWLANARILRSEGRGAVRGARIEQAGRIERRSCDLICACGGWAPNVHLTSHRGGKPVFREDLGAFVPGELPESQRAVGTLAGQFDPAAAARAAWSAGAAAAGGDTTGEPPWVAPPVTTRHAPVPAPEAPAATHGAGGKVFVDLQNDVTADDVMLAWREGYTSVEHLKRYTTLGMGTDQGRTSNLNGLRLMAALRGDDVPTTGTTTFRPPFAPVSLGALAARRVGPHFRLERRTPMHAAHLASGAEFVRAGAWLRPWFYAAHGGDAETAGIAEMRRVREGVGMVDVSTLGKIDVQGPDAAAFLDRVYANGWRKLPEGRARYGVMLRDDGFVLDDGTTSRIGEDRYFMTTTTAQAARVMSWLEYLLETAWPELRVHVTSVTDQWAGVAVAGPRSRETLVAALPGVALDDASVPPMAARDATCDDGLPVRILRVSFSGERAYEVYTPAGHGRHLWERLLEAGEPHGIAPYGTEALGGLRIEKGHPAGPELDGRTTLDDLGLGRLARPQKPFVGDVLRHREALASADRRRLVGLRPLDPGARLRAGSLVFPAGEPASGHGIGHVTSATYSPTLGQWIGLALLERADERRGQQVDAASPIHGERIAVEVVSPVFVDPEGERIHA